MEQIVAFLRELGQLPPQTATNIFLFVITVAMVYAVVILTRSMTETQRLHNETERRRNEERNSERLELKEVVALSENQQKHIEKQEEEQAKMADELRAATTVAGAASREAERATGLSNSLKAELDKERDDRRRENEEKQKRIDTLVDKVETLDRQLNQVQRELDKTRKDLELRNRENAELIELNKRLATERQADKEELEKRITELEALSAKLAGQLEETIKQRDNAIVEKASVQDQLKTMEQQYTEVNQRVDKIEIKTAPLALPEGERDAPDTVKKAA